MAIGITPDETFSYILRRERVPAEPKPEKDEKPEDFEARMADWRHQKAKIEAAIAEQRVTTWRIRTLSSRDLSRIASSTDREGWAFDAVRAGLAGWSDYRDRQGRPIEFATCKADVYGRSRDAVITDALLDRIPYPDIVELATAVVKTGVTEEELGNS